jgi:hypothetical protein
MFWTTRSGDVVQISEMSTQHIENCIRHLELNPIFAGSYSIDSSEINCDIDYELTDSCIKAFKKELNKRKNIFLLWRKNESTIW